jgi:hypothetical protein
MPSRVTPALTLKRNDTWPPLRTTLKQKPTPTSAEVAIDLTDAEFVRLYMRGPRIIETDPVTIDAAPASGKVSYQWSAGNPDALPDPIPADLAIPGDYECEFEITFMDGSVETVPNDGYFLIRVVEDLGPDEEA